MVPCSEQLESQHSGGWDSRDVLLTMKAGLTPGKRSQIDDACL
jgi:hypothetical protein